MFITSVVMLVLEGEGRKGVFSSKVDENRFQLTFLTFHMGEYYKREMSNGRVNNISLGIWSVLYMSGRVFHSNL